MGEKFFIGAVVFFSLLVVIIGYIFFNKSSSSAPIVFYKIEAKERPIVEVKKTFLDLGEMKVSEEKSATFTIKNIGKKPLQLYNLSSSCGCTVGQVVIDRKSSKEYGMHSMSDLVGEIAPGKEGQVKVIYRPYVMPVYGLVEREVYVKTNDPENPQLTFAIKAKVK